MVKEKFRKKTNKSNGTKQQKLKLLNYQMCAKTINTKVFKKYAKADSLFRCCAE